MEKFIRTDKIYHHPERLFYYRVGETVSPVTVEMHLTNKCNINCYYCSFKDKHDKVEMSLSNAMAAISKLAFYSVKGITFSGGGEPSVHDNLTDIIMFAKSLQFDVGLITNGVIFDPVVLNYLTWVRFSVDAADPFVYKKIKGSNKFHDVRKNLYKAVEYKKSHDLNTTIGFQVVVDENNYNTIIQCIDLATTAGADYFQYRPVEGGKYSELIKKQIEIYRRSITDKYHKRIKVIDSWYKWDELEEVEKYTECPGADFIGAVGADLNFYMCCHHVGDKTASYGNVLKDDIYKARKQVQDNFDYSKCPIACRGSVINRRLKAFNNVEHVNFL